MPKSLLVIGGSYFYGRVFSMLASREAGFSLTLLNRGRYSMSFLPNVTEYSCDRHDTSGLQAIPSAHYDAIVDFCGYAPGDIRLLTENLPCTADEYIFISTADVYERGLPIPPDETAPYLTERLPGPVGDYLLNKVQLERELAEVCAAKQMKYTVFRPSFLYGPYNYAPREAFFFEKIIRGDPIPYPVDANGKFQFVYVKDAALAVITAVNSPATASRVYNLASPEVFDYASYFAALRSACDLPVKTEPVTVDTVISRNIPLPFPLTRAENECFDGSRVCRELGVEYTPLADGLLKTYESMKSVLSGRKES